MVGSCTEARVRADMGEAGNGSWTDARSGEGRQASGHARVRVGATRPAEDAFHGKTSGLPTYRTHHWTLWVRNASRPPDLPAFRPLQFPERVLTVDRPAVCKRIAPS